MKNMNGNLRSRLIRSAFAAIVAMTISLLATEVTSMFIPVSLGPTEQIQIDSSKVYTRDELDRSDLKMREKIRVEQERIKASGGQVFIDIFKASKQNSIFFVWIPWLLLPILFPIRSYIEAAVVVSLPLLIAIAGLFLPIEILTFYVALSCGFIVKRLWNPR